MSSNSNSNNSVSEIYSAEATWLKEIAAILARFSSKEVNFLRHLGQGRTCWNAKDALFESGSKGNLVMFFLACEHLPVELKHYTTEAVQASIAHGGAIAAEYLKRIVAAADRGPDFLRDVRGILLAAAEAGNLQLVEMCCELRVLAGRDFDDSLYAAGCRGDQKMVELCFRFGGSDADKVLCGAAAGGHEDLMYLARRLGATRLNEAAAHATIHRKAAARALCLEWGASDGEAVGPEAL